MLNIPPELSIAHTLLLFINFDDYQRCQIQLCVVLSAVQRNANLWP